MGGLAWLPGGNRLLALGSAPPVIGANQLWFVSADGSGVRRVTNDLSNYNNLTLTADGTRLVTVQSQISAELWFAPAEGSGAERRINASARNLDGLIGLDWLPDGRVVYASSAAGSSDIWIMDPTDPESGEPRRLTTDDDAIEIEPAVSPDGESVIFMANFDGPFNLWRVAVEGGAPEKITSGDFDSQPRFSPDGRWIFFLAVHEGRQDLWKVPVDGGEAVEVLALSTAARFQLSPDGGRVLYPYLSDETNRPLLGIFDIQTGESLQTLPFPSTDFDTLQWTADGKALIWAETHDGVANLWSHPLDGGAPTQLTDFDSGRIFRSRYAPDGSLVVSRGTVESDVILIENFR